MWSIGNEVPTQCSPVGYKVAKFLQDICHREDPTRPVTCGMDQVTCVLANGFAAMIDIPGLNYRAHRYKEAYDQLRMRTLHWPMITIGQSDNSYGQDLIT